MRRRAGQPRALKQLSPNATRMLREALTSPGGVLSAMGPDLPPNLLPTMTAGLGTATWNRYAGVLGPWQRFAEAHHTPFLPADPAMFLRFLSETSDRERGQSQTKHRACAIDAISRLAGFPSPTTDRAIGMFRAGISRTKTAKRGPVTPIFPTEIPLPAEAAAPTALVARGRFLPTRSDPELRQSAAICHMWMMSAAGARFDDFQEGQIGDGLPFPDAFELTFFGTKTDPTLAGQPAVAPALSAPGSGTGVWADGLRAALDRLLSLSEDDARLVGERFRRTLLERNPRHLDGGASAMRAWPADIRQRTDRLYDLGIPAHCLPFYGRWLSVHPSRHMDLSEPIPIDEFVRAARLALERAGIDPTRVGAHSFRRGRGVHLALSGADLRNVTTLFRHRSPASTQPYLLTSARLADTADTLRLADARSDRRGTLVAGEHRGPQARSPLAPPLHGIPVPGVPGRGCGLPARSRPPRGNPLRIPPWRDVLPPSRGARRLYVHKPSLRGHTGLDVGRGLGQAQPPAQPGSGLGSGSVPCPVGPAQPKSYAEALGAPVRGHASTGPSRGTDMGSAASSSKARGEPTPRLAGGGYRRPQGVVPVLSVPRTPEQAVAPATSEPGGYGRG